MIMLPNLQVSLVNYTYLPIENAQAIISNHIAQLHNFFYTFHYFSDLFSSAHAFWSFLKELFFFSSG